MSYFVESREQENIDIINIDATVLSIAHAVLPGMIQSRRGLILVVGSFAGLIPTPLLATYSGSRAFVSTFTSALAEEVKRHNIVVQYLNTLCSYQDVEHSQIIFYDPNTGRICSCNVEQDWLGLRHCDDEFSKYPYPIVESHIA